MPSVDIDRLIPIVTGVQLNAELGDRPLAYRIEAETREILRRLQTPATADGAAALAPVVLSDAFYLNNTDLQDRPTISIGGPGMNALSALLVNQLPTVVAIENVLIVQMDLDMKDNRCSVWGMDHLDTQRAVELFISKGYLETFLTGIVGKSE